MTCVICRQGETVAAYVTVTLERPGATLVFKNVPARVCDNCGEQYVDETTSLKLLHDAEVSAGAGVQVEIRAYVAA